MRVETNREADFQRPPIALSKESARTLQGSTTERILVVEDDHAVQKALKRLFETEGFEIEVSSDGKSALEAFRRTTPSAIVLDLRLPQMSGRDVCREIKQQAPSIPIIVLSAASDVSDKVLLLELGADDYVTKPFSPRELLARIRAVLRRTQGKPGSRRAQALRVYRFAGFELRSGTRKLISPAGSELELTGGEFSLLVAFLNSPKQILTRDQLLEGSRLYDDVYDRSIDVQILRLRRKIESNPSEPQLIRTERGAGYYLDCEVEIS